MKQVLLLSVISSFSVIAQAQQALVKGALQNKDNGRPLTELEVTIPELKLMKVTNAEGRFTFSQVPYGTYKLVVNTSANKKETIEINVSQEVVDLGQLTYAIDDAAISASSGQAPTISLEENASSSDDDGISDQSVSGVLTASRDPYLAAASYTFGPQRYQLRGYKRDQLEVYMNGLPMNDAESGSAFFGQWGGLNDAFRNQTVTFGLNPSEVGFGGLAGSTQIEATAADQRKQTRISYASSNRTYRNRLMITHSSGLNEKGWAYSVSGSKRWSQEGYIPGTFYDGYSAYLAVSKKINNANSIHLTAFGAPTSRGKAMPATQEAMDLAGSNFYNPNWGYVDGEKKNARINNSNQPTAILTYKYNPNSNTQWNTSLGFQTGYNGNTAIDWYNAMDPRPDYYRNLPSYFLYDPRGADADMAAAQKDYLSADPSRMQVNWQRLYDANRMNVRTVNGVTGKRSVYLIGEDRDDINKYMFNTTLQKVVGNHTKITAGVAGILQKTESYRKAYDLLGGDYYVNLNQFAERTYIGNNDYNQNDLNNPNGIVYKGDKYGYDYKSDFIRSYAWGQGEFTYNKVDFFLTGRLGMESFQRTGIFKNGLFAGDSEGKSERFDFVTYAVKGGATYKIDGRNYLYVSGGMMTNAPTFDNTFISPRTRNKAIDNAKVERVTTLEGGYLLRSPFLNGRLSGFVTDTKDITDIKRFYHEDYRTFVNYVLQDVNVRNLGGELALKAKLSPTFSATAVASWTQVFYTSRPQASVYLDNDTSTKVAKQTIYMKDYYVSAGPQSAYTLGLNYNSPKYWYANINVNMFDRNFIEVNPARLTSDAVEFVQKGSDQWNQILGQEKLPAYFTVDLFCGTSLKLKKYLKGASNDMYLYLNVGVNNLLNNTNIRTGGFEQLRFDVATQNVDRFPAKYFYGYGANYFVNVTFKF
ncbi:TonB-dependent receptor [Taibaiella sp. KBW10]|uniref:carboxypeptidase-like regulatory domain-containing protein n=1 Tax=Taibaiella sp. KBW10 TaxID=2153357 RepID=UPI000F590498|nr:carboxypeptidase-like regulatory domain-containing protein [Taibaiella sp. KBW10]RQO32119.1 TonB-dependent receptor [Taibaiella sp. KBW10]